MAIKVERTDSPRPQLPIERDVFEIVSDSIYFPQMRYFGVHDEYNVLAMDLLGPSVEDLFNFCFRKFSIKTIVMIIEQSLRAIEALHDRSIIHRDLKPDSSLNLLKRFFVHLSIQIFSLVWRKKRIKFI